VSFIICNKCDKSKSMHDFELDHASGVRGTRCKECRGADNKKKRRARVSREEGNTPPANLANDPFADPPPEEEVQDTDSLPTGADPPPTTAPPPKRGRGRPKKSS